MHTRPHAILEEEPEDARIPALPGKGGSSGGSEPFRPSFMFTTLPISEYKRAAFTQYTVDPTHMCGHPPHNDLQSHTSTPLPPWWAVHIATLAALLSHVYQTDACICYHTKRTHTGLRAQPDSHSRPNTHVRAPNSQVHPGGASDAITSSTKLAHAIHRIVPPSITGNYAAGRLRSWLSMHHGLH
jgi:hypothetical protein